MQTIQIKPSEDFDVHETQKVVGADMHRFRVLCCGRRWGKTTLAIDQIKACAALRAGSRIAYIAPTFQQARDIAWTQLKRECKNAAKNINETRLEITLYNDSLIILRGWESIETLRGQKFNFIVIDEVASMRNFWLAWQEVVRPTLTDYKGEVLFISTPKGFNHFYDLFNLQETDADYKSFHYSTYDNPHVPKEEIDKAKQELSPERFAQEYMADFKKTEGLVYKEFDRARNVLTPQQIEEVKTRPHEILVGVDFGYTNPCAVLTILRDRADCLYVSTEFYETKRTDADVADYVATLKAQRVYPDPESPGAIEELRKRHVNLRDVIKGKDSIANGIQRVREQLKANKLFVSTECKNLIMEFETYVYPDKKDDKNNPENPQDENNHALDALRYVVAMTQPQNQGVRQFYPGALPNNEQLNTDILKNSVSGNAQFRTATQRYPHAIQRQPRL